jgi:hypothetical protein
MKQGCKSPTGFEPVFEPGRVFAKLHHDLPWTPDSEGQCDSNTRGESEPSACVAFPERRRAGLTSGSQLDGVRLDDVMPHRLFNAPQRDGLGESETAARQEGRILVRRALPPPDVDEHFQVSVKNRERLVGIRGKVSLHEEDALPGLTVVHLGRHFDGATVLYWPNGADGRGAVLSGDTLHVVMDRRYVSFMYSYPNVIPLSAEVVERIAAKMRQYRYERFYGAFSGRTVRVEGAQAIERSAEWYIRRLRMA